MGKIGSIESASDIPLYVLLAFHGDYTHSHDLVFDLKSIKWAILWKTLKKAIGITTPTFDTGITWIGSGRSAKVCVVYVALNFVQLEKPILDFALAAKRLHVRALISASVLIFILHHEHCWIDYTWLDRWSPFFWRHGYDETGKIHPKANLKNRP